MYACNFLIPPQGALIIIYVQLGGGESKHCKYCVEIPENFFHLIKSSVLFVKLQYVSYYVTHENL